MIRWTQRASADLKAIHDFIAADSPSSAKIVVREIVSRTGSLATAPRIGRLVPELRESELREISAYSWRILYQLREDHILVVTLVHRRRNLSAGRIREEPRQYAATTGH